MVRLQDFKTIFICPDHNEKYRARRMHMEDMLKTLGFTNVVHYKSGTEQFPICLTKATIDILKTHIDEPILLLDDDIVYTNVPTDIAIPCDVDAIYVGLSCQSTGNVHTMFERYSDTYMRVLNMLASHAILYYSRNYKQAVLDILEKNITRPLDVMVTHIQSQYQIIALKIPIFYQSMQYNQGVDFDVEFHTNIKLVTNGTGASACEQAVYEIVKNIEPL